MSRALKPQKKILIVDDEMNVCEFISEALKGAGYVTLIADSGYEALEKAQSAQPDLVILDVMMPGIDGWQVLERLRRNPRTKDIPVVMLTAKSGTESVLRSGELNVLDYFIKPIDAQELVLFVRRYADLRSQAE